MKKIAIGYLVYALVIFALLFGGRLPILAGKGNAVYESASGISYPAKTEGKEFFLYTGNDQWEPAFLTGVNLGSGKPGHFPGDFAITKDEYKRWFSQISSMNASTIRVYTIQMPEFYEALEEYNATSKTPIFLIHGVYLNEDDILRYQDAYADNSLIKNDFLSDIRSAVDVIHGNAKLDERAGHAWGEYTADVSPYVIAWILGIEWEAEFVNTTNENNPGRTSYDGSYVYTPKGITPFEAMLAEAVDVAIGCDTEKYQEQRPVAISNWVTSDPLDHPGEPNPEVEDAVSVDMENIRAKSGFEAGFFASYHVYPYYPDLFNYAQEYLEDGKGNTYKAYLEDLQAHHSMPLLISEVGIPSSRGIAHENIHSGFNQGHVSEEDQGKMLSSLIGDIHDTGCMGAIIFSWQDEWFKKTWNTMEYDIADRRPFWMDYQTNEQSFGLLSFDPGDSKSVCSVDGDFSEWTEKDVVTIDGSRRLSMKSDEKYVYLMAEVDDFESTRYVIALDTIAGQGNSTYLGADLGIDADFVILLDGKDKSTVLVDPYYDPTYYLYSVLGTVIPSDPLYEETGTGVFVPIRQMLSRGIHVPQTGEVIGYETFDTGALRYGIGNPDLPKFDSLADFYHVDGKVEIRLPWLLLNVVDPSSKRILGDMYAQGSTHAQEVDSFAVTIKKETSSTVSEAGVFSWEGWEAPAYHERLKASYPIIQNTYSELNTVTLEPKSDLEIFWALWNYSSITNVSKWFPIQPYLNYMIAFLLSVILYFFLVLLFVHLAWLAKMRQREQSRQKLLRITEADNYDKAREELAAMGLKRTLSSKHLAVLVPLLEELTSDRKANLSRLIKTDRFNEFVRKHLKTRDMEYKILLVRLIGEVRAKQLDDAVVEQMYSHPDVIDMQYHGLLALAESSDVNHMIEVLLDSNYRPVLSFRSLQEIFKTCRSGKKQLCEALLHSPDRLIVRICIRCIGSEKIAGLAPQIVEFLRDPDFNIALDSARSLGQLKYRPAAETIIELLDHERWEVRATAVRALACIDKEKYTETIAACLHDKEWQVRHNAAEALAEHADVEGILEEIERSGDRYAYQILRYMVSSKKIWGEASC